MAHTKCCIKRIGASCFLFIWKLSRHTKQGAFYLQECPLQYRPGYMHKTIMYAFNLTETEAPALWYFYVQNMNERPKVNRKILAPVFYIFIPFLIKGVCLIS